MVGRTLGMSSFGMSTAKDESSPKNVDEKLTGETRVLVPCEIVLGKIVPGAVFTFILMKD